jgi:hypothetical protein
LGLKVLQKGKARRIEQPSNQASQKAVTVSRKEREGREGGFHCGGRGNGERSEPQMAQMDTKGILTTDGHGWEKGILQKDAKLTKTDMNHQDKKT